MFQNLLISAQTGQGSSGQHQQGGSGPDVMSLLSKASGSGTSSVMSGAMALVSAYRNRNKRRKKAMRQAVIGVAMIGFGVWQIRRKGKSKSKGGGQGSGGQQHGSGGQQAIQ